PRAGPPLGARDPTRPALAATRRSEPDAGLPPAVADPRGRRHAARDRRAPTPCGPVEERWQSSPPPWPPRSRPLGRRPRGGRAAPRPRLGACTGQVRPWAQDTDPCRLRIQIRDQVGYRFGKAPKEAAGVRVVGAEALEVVLTGRGA